MTSVNRAKHKYMHDVLYCGPHYMVAKVSHTIHPPAIFNIISSVMAKVQVSKYISDPIPTQSDNYVLQKNYSGHYAKDKNTTLSGFCVLVLSGPGQIV